MDDCDVRCVKPGSLPRSILSLLSRLRYLIAPRDIFQRRTLQSIASENLSARQLCLFIRAHINGKNHVLGIDRSSARSTVSRAQKEDDPEELVERPRGGGGHSIKVDDEGK